MGEKGRNWKQQGRTGDGSRQVKRAGTEGVGGGTGNWDKLACVRGQKPWEKIHCEKIFTI